MAKQQMLSQQCKQKIILKKPTISILKEIWAVLFNLNLLID